MQLQKARSNLSDYNKDMPSTSAGQDSPSKSRRTKQRNHISLEIVVFIYLVLCMIWFALTTFVPFSTYIAKTPLKGLQLWLRHIGTAITAACFITKRGNFSLRSGILSLIVLSLLSLFSSLLHLKYGFSSNLNSVLWMLIVFLLFYNTAFQSERRKLRYFSEISYGIVSVLWFSGCCLSLYQFTHRIGYKGPNYSSFLLLSGKGFFKHRLYGIFNYPEYGAVTSLLLILWGIYYIMTVRKKWLRAVLAAVLFPFFVYIVLSGSRNAAAAMYGCALTGAFLFFRSMPLMQTSNPVKTAICSLLCAIFTVCCLHAAYNGTKLSAEWISEITFGEESGSSSGNQEDADKHTADNNSPKCLIPDTISLREIPLLSTSFFHGTGFFSPVPCYAMTSPPFETFRQADFSGIDASILSWNSAQKDQDLLKRGYKNNDITTGRVYVWKDYLSLWSEIGLFGLSPANSSAYILEHHPELYICTDIKTNYPSKYAKGYIKHPHSGYLKVYVSTGLLGLAVMILFIFGAIRQVFSHIIHHRVLPPSVLIPFLIVQAGASAALFDTELFFVYSPVTLIFWSALGFLLRECANEKK